MTTSKSQAGKEVKSKSKAKVVAKKSTYKFSSIAVFDKTNSELSNLTEMYSNPPLAINKKDDGYKFLVDAKSFLQKTRKAIIDAGKENTDDHYSEIKLINGERDRIVEHIQGLEAPILEAKKVIDDEEKRKKTERIAREQTKIDDMKAFVFEAKEKSSGEIEGIIEAVESIDTIDAFYELKDNAIKVQQDVIAELGGMLVAALNFEAVEAQRLQAEEATRVAQEEARIVKFKADEEARKVAEEAKRVADAAEEEKRKTEIKARVESKINNLKMIPTQFFGKSAKEIDSKISALADYDVYDDKFLFLERTEEAKQAKLQVIGQLGQMLASQKIVEKAADEAEKEIEAAKPKKSIDQIVDDFAQDVVNLTKDMAAEESENDAEEEHQKDMDALYGYIESIEQILVPETFTPHGNTLRENLIAIVGNLTVEFNLVVKG